MVNILQTDRLLEIETPLGRGKLLIAALTGTEGISSPFRFELDLRSEDEKIAFEDIIGKKVSISVLLADQSKKRHFHGIIASFGYVGTTLRASQYSAVLVPWLWLLTLRTDCRIFQNLNTLDIVQKVFQDAGQADFEFDLDRKVYKEREYCVQYNETDFDFVSRLLEEEGIHYYFRHEKDRHVMVLADTTAVHKPCPEQASAEYRMPESGVLEQDVITSFLMKKEIRSGSFVHKDYNFELQGDPSANDAAPNAESSLSVEGMKRLGRFEYPGNYALSPDGSRLAQIRLEEQEAQYAVAECLSTCRAFVSGYRFRLTNFPPRPNLEGDYLITAMSHHASEGSFFSDDSSPESKSEYDNAFTCIPGDTKYRPARRTPRPFIPGAQTAIVTGQSGEEIHTDKHGRVKVKFHWDRQGKRDESSSCWIRVGQIWAGKGFGAVFLPRIGDEVIVEFLEGNPDRPLITGKVYNGGNVPPYPLPAEKTKSTIKTNSTKQAEGFNEIRFEDLKEQEQIFIRGQRNLDIQVNAMMYETVGKDSNIVVKNDRYVTVEKDSHETVKENRFEEVGKDFHVTIMGTEAKEVTGKLSLQVKGDLTEKHSGNLSQVVSGNAYIKGKNVVIEADANITLKVGGCSISIGAGGITLSPGAGFEIKNAGKVEISGATVDIKAAGTARLTGGAMAEITGAMVKIN